MFLYSFGSNVLYFVVFSCQMILLVEGNRLGSNFCIDYVFGQLCQVKTTCLVFVYNRFCSDLYCTCKFYWVVPEKIHPAPRRTFLLSRGGGEKIFVSDNSKCIRTSKEVGALTSNFLCGGWFGCFLE
jgi:hypothetical protein